MVQRSPLKIHSGDRCATFFESGDLVVTDQSPTWQDPISLCREAPCPTAENVLAGLVFSRQGWPLVSFCPLFRSDCSVSPLAQKDGGDRSEQ